jgi:DNA-directed RNA polymerase subunit RPC12/RpoP
MVLAELKCQMCGKHFETEMLDEDDQNERHRMRMASPVRCPQCRSSQVELLRILRRVHSAR